MPRLIERLESTRVAAAGFLPLLSQVSRVQAGVAVVQQARELLAVRVMSLHRRLESRLLDVAACRPTRPWRPA
jgi:hypothetical protein